MRSSFPQILLVRHGETEWSKTGRHTSYTDIPLTEEGERQATKLQLALAHWEFKLVLCSPRKRAIRTCEITHLLPQAEIDDNLQEWHYGDYEGITTAEIRNKDPHWTIFTRPTPHGETSEQVATRCDYLISRIRAIHDDVVLFAHGHVLRVMIARWLGFAPIHGRCFALQTGKFNIMSYEHESPVLASLNTETVNDSK